MHNISSSLDENEDANSEFFDLMMDDSDKEKRHDPKKRKKEKKVRVATTDEKKKRRSKWWAHFTDNEEDPTFASCKYCQQLIGCSTKNGTTPLANHISRCKKYPPNLDKKQKLIDFESRTLINEDGTTETELRKLGGGPSEDLKRVSCFLPFLSVFYDATLRLSGSSYVTCNSYAHEIYGTRLMISNNINDDDDGVRKMAVQMMSKHKLNYVDWIVRDSYDETKANLLCLNIKMVLQSLFDAYASSMPSSNMSGTSSSTSTSFSTFTQSGAQSGRKVDLQQLMTSKYQRDTGFSLTNANKSMKNLTLEQPDIIIDETINSLDEF
ncbi:hypothetical protein V6N11_041555 [Hibiscus sabdariffa]|uniref:BED-type domain-containing protein n=1 Tax=Hibiscus sabdariffa TaxID=183260 RepID=A0ABR2RL74_9ROSI